MDKLGDLCFILYILNLRTNSLRKVFQILHTLSYTGASGAVAFIIEFVSISFKRSNEILELFKLLHFIRVLGLKISFLLPI